MFREIREIKEVKEIRDDKRKEENQNYLKIKPETDITEEECREFWDQIFGSGSGAEIEKIGNEAWLIGQK